MQTTMDFLTEKLKTSYKELITPCRQQYIVDKRWIVINFYVLSGEKRSVIAKLLKIDRNSVDYAVDRSTNKIKLAAQNLYNIYNGLEPLPQADNSHYTVLVPDYLHSRVVKEWI